MAYINSMLHSRQTIYGSTTTGRDNSDPITAIEVALVKESRKPGWDKRVERKRKEVLAEREIKWVPEPIAEPVVEEVESPMEERLLDALERAMKGEESWQQ
jgi:hypothetical protein